MKQNLFWLMAVLIIAILLSLWTLVVYSNPHETQYRTTPSTSAKTCHLIQGVWECRPGLIGGDWK